MGTYAKSKKSNALPEGLWGHSGEHCRWNRQWESTSVCHRHYQSSLQLWIMQAHVSSQTVYIEKANSALKEELDHWATASKDFPEICDFSTTLADHNKYVMAERVHKLRNLWIWWKQKRTCDKINSKPPFCRGADGVVDFIKKETNKKKQQQPPQKKTAQKKYSKTTKQTKKKKPSNPNTQTDNNKKIKPHKINQTNLNAIWLFQGFVYMDVRQLHH